MGTATLRAVIAASAQKVSFVQNMLLDICLRVVLILSIPWQNYNVIRSRTGTTRLIHFCLVGVGSSPFSAENGSS